MNYNKEIQSFLHLEKNKISFAVFENSNHLVFIKNEFFSDDINDYGIIINKFLEKNLFTIEKKIQRYIKNVNVILNHNQFLEINISIKDIRKNNEITKNDVQYLISDLKKQVLENNHDYSIISIKINKFIINEKIFENFEEIIGSKNFCVEASFIILSNIVKQNLILQLSKFELELNKIISTKSINSQITHDPKDNEEMMKVAKYHYNGDQNEVHLAPKNNEKLGFFEKVFNFFG